MLERVRYRGRRPRLLCLSYKQEPTQKMKKFSVQTTIVWFEGEVRKREMQRLWIRTDGFSHKRWKRYRVRKRSDEIILSQVKINRSKRYHLVLVRGKVDLMELPFGPIDCFRRPNPIDGSMGYILIPGGHVMVKSVTE